MPKQPSFDIIVTVFNRLEYTKRTIASLIDSGAITQCQRFIIVDNCSVEPGMAAFLENMKTQYGAFILSRPVNNGWGMAVNDALGLLRAEYLLLCNNDVTFEPNFMDKAFYCFEKFPTIGILGLWRHTAHGDRKDGLKTDFFIETDNTPAVAWLIPRSAMEKVGMLVEKGPSFTKGGNGEDSDYVMKMQEAGYKVGSPVPDLAVHIDGY